MRERTGEMDWLSLQPPVRTVKCHSRGSTAGSIRAPFVGRLKRGEHPGAPAISAKAFTQGSTRRGPRSPRAHHATSSSLAEVSDPRARGAQYHSAPRRRPEAPGHRTSKGRNRRMDVDMSRQGEKTHSDDEEIVAPDPRAQPRK